MTNELEEKLLICKDALSHISRVAMAARQPTKRLDWIAARAKDAARGRKWDRDYMPEPGRAKDIEMRELMNALQLIVEACATENLTAIEVALEEATKACPETMGIINRRIRVKNPIQALSC